MEIAQLAAHQGVLLGGLSHRRQGKAAQRSALQSKAKQHGLVIQRVISPGRFDPSATHCNEQNSSSTQSSELQSKSGRALETVPFLMCFHINCIELNRTATQSMALKSKSDHPFTEWVFRCVLGHIKSIESQSRASQRRARHCKAKHIG